MRPTRSIFAMHAVELAGEIRRATVDREVGVVDSRAVRRRPDLVLQRHGARVAEVQAMAGLGDDDGRLAVRREVQVVRIVDRPPPGPGLPVRGSIGVRLPSLLPRSALFAAQSVRSSPDGTTCCGLRPTLKVSTTFIAVPGRSPRPSCHRRLGTYTRARLHLTAALRCSGPRVSLYRLCGSTTGGMPGTVVIAPAGAPAQRGLRRASRRARRSTTAAAMPGEETSRMQDRRMSSTA